MKYLKHSLIFIFLFSVLHSQGQDGLSSTEILDSLKNAELKDTATINQFTREYLDNYRSTLNFDEQLIFLEKLEEAAERIDYRNANIYIEFAETYHGMNNPEMQKNALDKAIKSADFEKNLDIQSKYYQQLGLYYYRKDSLKGLTTNFIKALSLSEKSGNTKRSGILSVYVAELFYHDYNYEKSLKFNRKALNNILKTVSSTSTETKHIILFSSIYYSLAKSFNKLTKVDSVLFYQKKVDAFGSPIDSIIATKKERQGQQLLRICHNSILTWNELKQVDKTHIWYERAKKVSNFMSREYDKNEFIQVELAYFIANKNIKKAKETFTKLKPNITYPITNEILLKNLVNYYYLVGDYKQAFELQKDLSQIITEEKSKINNRMLNEFEVKYQTQEKEKEIAELKVQELAQQKRTNLFLAFSIGLLFLAGGLVYFLRQKSKDLANQKLISKQAEELQELNAAKVRLFTNVSHELRTPLTLILGNLNALIKRNNIPHEAFNRVHKVKQQSKELLTLVDGLLDASKRDKIEEQPQSELFLLQDFVVSLENNFTGAAERKEIDFQCQTELPKDSLFSSDVHLLSTITKNLVSNSLKYTPEQGNVQLQLTLQEGELEIRVKDNGPGIPEKDLPHIFERYYQSDSGKKSIEGGFGIGLSICKDYVDKLQGRIEVHSKAGEGSEFVVRIPSMPIEPNGKRLYQFVELETTGVKVFSETVFDDIQDEEFILVVEDNLDLCDYLKSILEEDYHLIFAHNGREATRVLERHRPRLIITDLMMPVMDGMTMIEDIKKNKRQADLPIIVLTAKDSVLDEIKAARFGVEEYLRKPFEEDELKARIDHLLHLDEQRVESLQEAIVTEGYVGQLKNSQLKTSKEQQTSRSDQEWVKKVEEKISPLVTDMNLNVDKICAVLEISPTHLTRQMKALVGMTPKRYINELRLLMGRRMLENKEYDSVKAVAYSVGFKSEKVFSRKFRERFGKYPSTYLN